MAFLIHTKHFHLAMIYGFSYGAQKENASSVYVTREIY